MICGMPDPRASGAKRRVSQTSNAKPAGVISNGASGAARAIARKSRLARSAACAKSKATRPRMMAPERIAARRGADRTRGDDEDGRRIAIADLVREPETVHRPRHLDVCQHDADGPVCVQDVNRLIGVFGGEGAVACILEEIDEGEADQRLVL